MSEENLGSEPPAEDSRASTTPSDGRLERLRSWSMDEPHVVQSVRHYEPQYRNPGELRADVRELLARYDAVRLYRVRVEGRA